jgi:hypothetical protein
MGGTILDSTSDADLLAAPSRITVVSGLPRAGTSLLMQILEAAGLALARDDGRPPDPDNPRGYHELAAVKRIQHDKRFLADCRGRVVKIVAPLLTELPSGDRYRVLFVERDLGEVLASQRALLLRRGVEPKPVDEAALARAFETALVRCRAWLAARPQIEMLSIDHRDLLETPDEAVAAIAAFLMRTADLQGGGPGPALAAGPLPFALRSAMARAIDPSLHRQRG